MPHDPVTIKQDVLEKSTRGGHDMVVLTKYEAPATDTGAVAHDEYRDKDLAIAEIMMKWLQKHYPGYPWATMSEIMQGIVGFSIPILMGSNFYFTINLRTTDIVEGLHKGAGEILERYRQPRDGFNLGAFLEARAKHSKLVLPSRLIPA